MVKEYPTRPIPGILSLTPYHDLERRMIYLQTIINDAMLSLLTRNRLYWLDGSINGGDMDGCSPAMDYLDPAAIDGGAL